MAAHQKILHIEKRGWKCIKHAEYPTNRREYKGCKTSRGPYKMLGDDKNVKEKRGHNITLGVKNIYCRIKCESTSITQHRMGKIDWGES